MAKNKEVKNQAEQAVLPEKTPSKIRISFTKLGYWLVVLLVIYALAKNPDIIKKYVEYAKSLQFSQTAEEEETKIDDFAEQLSQMQNEIYSLKNMRQPVISQVTPEDFDKFEARIDKIEKQNLNVIDSKADASAVLGIIARLDKVEERLDALAKITDQGALVLSAAMLVKESADSGAPFEYEAEILQQLAKGDVKLNEPVAVLVKYAGAGVQTKNYLINEFESIYKSLLKEQKQEFEKTWKDRINTKLNEIIKVKRVNKNAPEFEANRVLAEVSNLVKNGNLPRALAELELPENQKFLENQALKKWQGEARAKVAFDSALARISTYSLALMKINYIKKETIND